MKANEIRKVLVEEAGLDEAEIDTQVEKLLKSGTALTEISALRRILRENAAQEIEKLDLTGVFLADIENRKRHSVWVFSQKDDVPVRISREDAVEDYISFGDMLDIKNLSKMRNIQTDAVWLEWTDATTVDMSKEKRLDFLNQRAYSVRDIRDPGYYLIKATAKSADSIGIFEEGELVGREPVVEDEDTANVRIVLTDETGKHDLTMKVHSPELLAKMIGVDLDAVMSLADREPADAAREVGDALAERTFLIFGRGSVYSPDGDILRRPWIVPVVVVEVE